MLSQEKIRGFIVDPHCNCVWTNIEIIPAVWACFVTDKLINRNPCFSLVWKEKLGVIDKRKKFDCFPLLYFNEYKEMEKDALEDWGGFCDEFEKLKSEETFRFAQAFPYLVRSMQEKERNRFYVLFDGFEWKITEIYVEASFGQIQKVLRNDWIEGEETIELIPVGEVDGDCKIEVSPWPELENFLEKKFPGRVRPLSGLPESWNTVPADPAAVPAEFVPAVIQGTFAKIQDSVRDSKRETTLTENKKQTGIQERILEELQTQTELQKQTKNLLEQRIKPNTDLRQRAAAFNQLKNKYKSIMQLRAEFWFSYCLPIGLDWKGVYEGENGRPCDLTGEELERNRNLYEKSIREYRKDEYDKFKRQKKQE